jgi:hypothetical protein
MIGGTITSGPKLKHRNKKIVSNSNSDRLLTQAWWPCHSGIVFVVKPPAPNKLGWKETIRMNPLEDVIVALRPIMPNVRFDIPNSVRPLDVTMPLNTTMQFTGVNPTNQPAPVTNQNVNFGWEYVWNNSSA